MAAGRFAAFLHLLGSYDVLSGSLPFGDAVPGHVFPLSGSSARDTWFVGLHMLVILMGRFAALLPT